MLKTIAQFWDDAIVPAITDYIRIPAKSPHFDRDWQKHGYIDAALQLAVKWCQANPLNGMKLEVVRLEGRTPVLFVEVAGQKPETVLIYGHLDKQPEMVGWREGYGPWQPRMVDGKLYGRGGADDGYAVFCAFAALKALQGEGRPHARCVILIECCEESGSYDLPAYLDHLATRIRKPDFVVGLDSGCGNYRQLWGTTSLRGLLNGVLTVEVLTEGVHSGRRERRRADELSHRPGAHRPHRRRCHRCRKGEILPRPNPEAESGAGEARRSGAARRDLAQVPVRGRVRDRCTGVAPSWS